MTRRSTPPDHGGCHVLYVLPSLSPAEGADSRATKIQCGSERQCRCFGVGVLALLLLLPACTISRPMTVPGPPGCGETFYASVYSTRNTRLSGQNPVVGLFYSVDGGETWTHTGWEQGHLFAAMAVPGGCGDTLFLAAGNGVMRTTDGGRFWKITTGWQVTEVQDVTINPARPAQVFAATPYGLFRTDDLGRTWNERSNGLDSRFVAAVRVDRTRPERIWAGTEAGLFVSDDAGEGWRATSVREPVRSIRQSPSDPQRWVAGLQDRGVALSTDGGRTWQYGAGDVAGHTIYESEFHPGDPDVLYAGGWQTGVLRSADFGRTWQRLDAGLAERSVHSLLVSRARDGFLLAGTLGGGLFRSTDDGRSWQPVAPSVFDASQVWDLYVEGEQ